MAVAELNLSRRALLGAAFAAPAFLRHPELVSGSMPPPARPSSEWMLKQVQHDEIWRNAIARFRLAEARLKALEHDPDEDRFDNANAVFYHALKKLMRTSAPDLPALSLKIDLAVDHEVAELTGGHACLAALKRDAARLVGRMGTGTYLSPSSQT